MIRVGSTVNVELNPSKQLSQNVANRKYDCIVITITKRRDPILKRENFLYGAYMRVIPKSNMIQLLTSVEYTETVEEVELLLAKIPKKRMAKNSKMIKKMTIIVTMVIILQLLHN